MSEDFEWPTLDMPYRSSRGKCRATINQLAILSDGSVVPCCFDCEGVIKLGNANEKTIVEILNSERAMAIYNGFKKTGGLLSPCVSAALTLNDSTKDNYLSHQSSTGESFLAGPTPVLPDLIIEVAFLVNC